MKVTLVLDGEPREVDVDLAQGVVRVAGVELPVKVVGGSAVSVEVEVAGERVKVDGWMPDQPSPIGPVTVDGERYKVSCELSGTPEVSPAPHPPAATPRGTPATGASAAPVGADSILPPMPGKVIEVRVREGDRVEKGAVLLILEAMKMRNEVTAPKAGFVRHLRVSPGSSVQAREPMLSISSS